MKQVILGDIHGRTIWKDILSDEHDADRVIFIGDYFDTHEYVSGLQQLHNFKDICAYKKDSGKDVIMLIGNHDHHYFPEVGYTGTSGYQSRMRIDFESAINENRKMLQMAFRDEHGTVYTHAGISKTWLAQVKILYLDPAGIPIDDPAVAVNILFKIAPKAFCYNNIDWSGYGDHVDQTPIWIRPQSLYVSHIDNLQVVGHTGVNSIKHPPDGIGFYMIDALAQGEYLICDNGKFEIRQKIVV